MKILSSRCYYGEDDLHSMIELTRSLRIKEQVVYPVASDLFEDLADPSVQKSARIWENDLRQMTGFVYISPYQNMVYAFDADEFTPVMEKEVVNWAISAMQQRNKESGQEQTLDASALASDLPRQTFLERNGFLQQEESSIIMGRSLVESLPEPALPAGFTLRPMGGEVEVEAYVALHQAAFGTENMTVEFRRAIMSAPDYISDLDLVAVAPGGSLAAFCVCQIFPDDSPRGGGQREGWTDPVGTHPAYRYLGLARALMLTGMHLLKERGIDTAILGTSSNNTGMQRTAQSIGFQIVSTILWYSRPVS